MIRRAGAWASVAEGPLKGMMRADLLLLLAALSVLFAPVLFMGEHAVAFHYQWGSQTGLAWSGDEAACRWATRHYDASPILIHYPDESLAGEALRRGELPT